MLQCVECGSRINTENMDGERIECDACGIELEIVDNILIGLQLGPPEE
jgi:lysine biosynthesis protein LysW